MDKEGMQRRSARCMRRESTMRNLIILYDPYYNQKVISHHMRILNQHTNIPKALIEDGWVID